MISPTLVRTFLVRRWLRTVPNYLLFLPIYLFLLPIRQGSFAELLPFTQNLAWPNTTSYAISWSLCVEEWFYLLIPLLSLLTFTACRKVRTSFLFAAVVLFVVSLALRLTVGMGQPRDAGIRKVVAFRLDAIMWGIFLAVVHRYRALWFQRMHSPAVVILALAGTIGATSWVGWR